MWEILKFERLIIGNSTAMIMKAYRNVISWQKHKILK